VGTALELIDDNAIEKLCKLVGTNSEGDLSNRIFSAHGAISSQSPLPIRVSTRACLFLLENAPRLPPHLHSSRSRGEWLGHLFHHCFPMETLC
jgi:hypothetical protein